MDGIGKKVIILVSFALNFALLLFDDHSGASVPNGHRFIVNGRAVTPLQKPDDYLVFSGLEGKRFELTVDSATYVRQVCVAESGAMVQLRLLRREDASFGDCERLRGTFRARASVFAAEEGGGALRLQTLECVEGEERLAIFGYLLPGMVRQRFFLGEKGNREEFIMKARMSDGIYLSDRPFQKAHKQGEPIVRAFHDVCGPDGSFAIPIPPEQLGKIKSFGYFGKGGKYGTACL